ncbi:MAG: GAF domain-containing protein [Sphaerochaeta sp.]|nr:GAF domain-containing protein [Sphaerochaeta sp.]MDX9915020.1 GAF domain-containing protein [Sphaerochaeta sp.]
MVEGVRALVDDCRGSDLKRIGALANVAAYLNERLERINWVGFYLTDESGERLLLGPFQGKVACTEIPFERGVCGLAARTKKSQRIADVHAVTDHIVCDSASRSELVVPLVTACGSVVGVLDIDSPDLDRFTAGDEHLLCQVASVVVSALYS